MQRQLSRHVLLSAAVSIAALSACTTSDTSTGLLPSEALLAKGGPPPPPTIAFWFPLDDAALGVRSDHLFTSGTSSVYAEGVCGVHATIFTGSGSGDAIMHTDNTQYKDRKCTADPRNVTVVYGPDDEATAPTFINVREIANSTYQIPLDSTVRRALNVRTDRCDGLRWTAVLGDGTNTNGADSVNVTRTSATTWLVETQPAPDNEAYCVATGQKYNIAVKFTVVSSAPIP